MVSRLPLAGGGGVGVAERAVAAPSLRWQQATVEARRAWALLDARPREVLGGLVLVQWLAVLAWALTVRHNAWLYYQGGDQTYYWSSAWAMAHGHIPQSSIGFGWPLVLLPFAGIVGANVIAGLPPVVLLQTLVLLPVGLLAVYGIGTRISGRAIGYLAAAGWIAAPFIAIPAFRQDYHERWTEQFLSQAFGFTGLADFASMILVVCAAYVFLRALETGADADAVVSGLITGFAIGVKPANVLFAAGPALAVLVARCWRVALVYSVALIPGAVALALWKQKGLGEIPLLHATAVPTGAASAAPPLAVSIPDSINLDWGHLGENLAQLREFFWSMRLVEVLPFAGLIAVARASWMKTAFFGGWLGAFVVIKGTSHSTAIENATFFRLLMPAWPAYLLLAACLPLLVPGVARRLRAQVPRVRPLALRSAPVAVAAVVLALVPLAAMAALPPDRSGAVIEDFDFNTTVAERDFGLRAVRHGRNVVLTWRPQQSGPTRVFYRVYWSPSAGQAPIGGVGPYRDGIACLPSSGGATVCRVLMELLPPTRATTFAHSPPPGSWTYRVGLLANWADDEAQGDVLLLSEPVRVRVRP